MTVELERVWDDSDFFRLTGGSNWATVEGSADEWLAIADALDELRDGVRFKRCALSKDPGGWELYSPRNASGPSDCVVLTWGEGEELAQRIRETVAAAVFEAWA